MYNTRLHFFLVGIAGSGMSSIAEVLIAQGFVVSGSDLATNSVTQRLAARGAVVYAGHAAEHLAPDVSLLVYTSAVSKSNPELVEAKRRGIPIVPRAEVLAELMRLKHGIAVSGAHGKTTTTSFIGAILEGAGLDPTVVVGGELAARDSGACVGQGQYLVAEADESDRSFLMYRPSIAVITNIEDEHLIAYRSSAEIDEAFLQFGRSVPFYGLVAVCADCPRAAALVPDLGRRVVLYGFSEAAHIRGSNVRHSPGAVHFEVSQGGFSLGEVSLAMPGAHMAQNALAAIAVALELGVPIDIMRLALAGFRGVARRFQTLDVVGGVRVMTDYGHHPTEVAATITAIRASWGGDLRRLLVVFQPHRYTRTRDCAEQFVHAFAGADTVWITDIYPAGEDPIAGITGAALCASLCLADARSVIQCDDAHDTLLSESAPGDVILFLGAGSVAASAERFVDLVRAVLPRLVA